MIYIIPVGVLRALILLVLPQSVERLTNFVSYKTKKDPQLRVFFQVSDLV